MKVGIVGLWHLGTVTAACLAQRGFEVIAYDNNSSVIDKLANNQLPVFEPGLQELIANSKIFFTTNPKELNQVDVLWITYDTPVDDDDNADINFVIIQIKLFLPHLKNETLILISSQLPVGTTRQLSLFAQLNFPEKKLSFAYSPENLRLGKAIEVFTQPDRVVIGIEKESDKERISKLFNPFTGNLLWMSIESAEMTKHAVNAFLASSVVFINELSTLCEMVGADAREVEFGLKSEMRIGQKAYLKPGGAFAGGTLARDVIFLKKIGSAHSLPTPLFSSILESNDLHKKWAQRQVQRILNPLRGKVISILGLTYKPGTDTLRRSNAIETANFLFQQGAKIQAYDPVIKILPEELQYIQLHNKPLEALYQADAVIIATEWPELKALKAEDFLTLKQPLIFDAGGFLAKILMQEPQVRYFTVGKV